MSSMKKANQVREYCRRKWYKETDKTKRAVYLEILHAFDTPHKTKLVMPK